MWDIFNKETVKELRTTVKDLESKLSSKERELQKLDSELTKQISRYSELSHESETKRNALDAVLDELKAFLIQNREKNLHYDCLEVTKELIDDFADVKEYAIDLQVQLRNLNSKYIQRHFLNFIYTLQVEGIVSSFRIEIDQPTILKRRYQEYRGFVRLYSISSIHSIENLFLELLHKRKVSIEKHVIENDKVLTVKGNIRESYY